MVFVTTMLLFVVCLLTEFWYLYIELSGVERFAFLMRVGSEVWFEHMGFYSVVLILYTASCIAILFNTYFIGKVCHFVLLYCTFNYENLCFYSVHLYSNCVIHLWCMTTQFWLLVPYYCHVNHVCLFFRNCPF